MVLCKNWEMMPKKFCEVFCKITQICSAKILKGVLWKKLRRFFAKILMGILQKYREVFCRITKGSSTLWRQMNNFFVKAQRLGLFPVISWPSTLGDQEMIINYWERGHSQSLDTLLNMRKVHARNRRSYDL